MDKIICDVCGTSYPETAGQCPICGYVKRSRPKSAAQEESPYAQVKGGRFSNANVKRRNLGKSIPSNHAGAGSSAQGPDMAVGIAIIAVLLVLIIVLIFFIIKAIGDKNTPVQDSGSQTQQTTVDPDVPVHCHQLHTNSPKILLNEAGAKWVLHTSTIPAEVADPVTYRSLDPDIATVDDSGTVTAVSGGETAIVARCGNAMLIITVDCSFANPDDHWSLNRQDITLSKKGETWDLYSKTSNVAKNRITWSSDDESIARIDGGIVEAVGSGVTKVHAEYNGTKYSCTVRCKLPGDAGQEGDQPTEPDDGQTALDPETLKISHSDVTISVKETFNLRLRDASGKTVEVKWTVSRDGFVSIDGNKITGLKSTKNDFVTVSTTYCGKTFKCIVRVK